MLSSRTTSESSSRIKSSRIAATRAARAEPDGYTLLVNSSSHAAVAGTYAKLSYDPANDFAGIAMLANLPISVVAPLKYKTLADLVDAGRKKSLNFGSSGAGSAGHARSLLRSRPGRGSEVVKHSTR